MLVCLMYKDHNFFIHICLALMDDERDKKSLPALTHMETKSCILFMQ
jgi:hypothetical protein